AHIAVGTGGVPGGGTSYGASVTGLVQKNAQYGLWITPAGVASRANRLVTLASGPVWPGDGLPLPFFRLMGDFNGDNIVNSADVTLLQQHLDTRIGMAGFDPVYDLNDDGVTDRIDQTILQNALGTTTDVYAPSVAGSLVPAGASTLIQSNAF